MWALIKFDLDDPASKRSFRYLINHGRPVEQWDFRGAALARSWHLLGMAWLLPDSFPHAGSVHITCLQIHAPCKLVTLTLSKAILVALRPSVPVVLDLHNPAAS